MKVLKKGIVIARHAWREGGRAGRLVPLTLPALLLPVTSPISTHVRISADQEAAMAVPPLRKSWMEPGREGGREGERELKLGSSRLLPWRRNPSKRAKGKREGEGEGGEEEDMRHDDSSTILLPVLRLSIFPWREGSHLLGSGPTSPSFGLLLERFFPCLDESSPQLEGGREGGREGGHT